MDTVIQLYKYLIYPTPLFILNGSLSTASLLTPDVFGRIDGWGLFTNGSLLDYYYAFAVLPGTGIPNVYVQNIAWNASTSTVMFRGIIEFGLFFGNVLVPVVNITQSGRFILDNQNRISYADLIVHNAGVVSDPSLVPVDSYITNFCTEYFSFCNLTTDPYGYYGTMSNCIAFMNGESYTVPNGTLVTNAPIRLTSYNGVIQNVSFSESSGNTRICRNQHVTLARYVPIPHCSHAGITGGSDNGRVAAPLAPCQDVPYYYSYYEPFQNFGV